MNGITTDGYVANGMYDNLRYGNGYGVGSSSFANPSANAVRINRNDQTVRDTNECTRAENRLGLDRISAQNKEDRDNQRFSALEKSITDSEIRGADRARDIENLMIAGQKEAAQCCCDAKLQSCKDTADLKALIISENSKTRELIQSDALEQARAKITQLETINALRPA